VDSALSAATFRGWARQLVTDYSSIARHTTKWVLLGAVSGLLAGLSSYLFLVGLDRVTETRLKNGWLVYLLPLAGLGLGMAYHYFGGRASQGKSLLISEIHEPTDWVPRRMAPMVLVGTWITHLVGGSAGREGTALQLAGGLTDSLARYLPITKKDRQLLLNAALGGGFGAVFGVPLAGAIFAMEVLTVGRLRTKVLIPALSASVVGNAVVHGLGYKHGDRPGVLAEISALTIAKVLCASVVFGLTAATFAGLSKTIRGRLAVWVPWPPLRQTIGATAVLGLALLFGRDYLGLSIPLMDAGLSGADVALWVFALKLVFTAVTFGSGLPGGEVTPLFVIGATLGAALAPILGIEPKLLAAVGFVAVFAAASNTPLACTVMGLEFFGTDIALALIVGCVAATVCSGPRSIYPTQRVHVRKDGHEITETGVIS
jgi:H+/Cl- antiporter ClcA